MSLDLESISLAYWLKTGGVGLGGALGVARIWCRFGAAGLM